MAVRIRLTRVGATKRPAYRVIAIDGRRPRDGRALEILGFYDPLTEPATVQLQTERISAWIGKGAQPSDTVVRLMRQAEKAATQPAVTPKRPTRAKAAPKASAKAAAPAPEPKAEKAENADTRAAKDEAASAPDASAATAADEGTESAQAADAGATPEAEAGESDSEHTA